MGVDRFEDSYRRYLILRGYDPAAGKLRVLRRALVESWAEPGFHRFWQVWNPGIGHLLFRLYRALGGRRRRLIATLVVFAACGALHDLVVMLMFRRPFVAFTAAFVLSGLLAAANRRLEPVLRQRRWPGLLNALANATCLAGSIAAAVQVQRSLFP